MIDSGETAQDAAPKGKRRTLRQKDRILDDTLESNDAPTKPNLSGTKTERMNMFICSCAFLTVFQRGFKCLRILGHWTAYEGG